MTARGKDYGEAVFQLLAQYGEDFSFEYSSEREAFDSFAWHSIGNPRRPALAALDRLLADADDEADLEAALEKNGLNYRAPVVGHASYRDFVLMLRGWLVESLAERPDTGEG
jgi:hypothetical protein